jgi:hypothetical protein
MKHFPPLYRRPALGLLLLGSAILSGCATDRPIVSGMLTDQGMIYTKREPEPWGARSTLNVRPIEF